jgi:hypothetical protein
MKKFSLLLPVVLCFGMFGLQAQQVLTTSGGNASGSGGTVSYTVGQIVYTTNTGTNGSAVQGVQQPFEISVVTGIEEALGISLEIMVYPNPTTDFLTLSVDNFEASNLSYYLYDINGRLLETKKLEGKQTSIAMSNLVPATYFLKVSEGSKELRTFKIIKN